MIPTFERYDVIEGEDGNWRFEQTPDGQYVPLGEAFAAADCAYDKGMQHAVDRIRRYFIDDITNLLKEDDVALSMMLNSICDESRIDNSINNIINKLKEENPRNEDF